MNFGKVFGTSPMFKMWLITMKPRSQRISLNAGFTIRRSLIPFMKTPQGCSIGLSYYKSTAILNHKVLSSVQNHCKQWRNYALYFLTSWACIGLPIRLDSQPHVYDWSSDPSPPRVSWYLKNRGQLESSVKKLQFIFMSFMWLPLGRISKYFQFHFAYDLWITTDEEKKQAINNYFLIRAQEATVCGRHWALDRDVLPILLLKEPNSQNLIMLVPFSIPRKSSERRRFLGRWILAERIDRIITVKPADQILANMEANPKSQVLSQIFNFLQVTIE